MSREALAMVVQRSISDGAFRRQLTTDPSGALRGYDLAADEVKALTVRDAAKLTAFGIDVRMSKLFTTFDPGSGGTASLAGGGEPRDVAPVWIGDGSTASEAATGTEPRDVAPVWIGDGSTPLQVHTYSGDDNSGPVTEAATGTEPRDVAPVWIGESGVTSDVQITTGDGDLDQ